MKRNYSTLVPQSINVNYLRRQLLSLSGRGYNVGRHVTVKLPLDMEGTYHNMPVYPSWGQGVMGHFTIVVKKHEPSKDICRWTGKARKSSKHRIFIQYGDKLIPAGRAAQAKI